MRLLLSLSLMLSTSLFAFVDSLPLDTYYGEDFERVSARRLDKEYLFKILSKKHVVVGYSQARKILFGELHIEKDGKGKFVEDVYCGKRFYFRQVEDVSNMGNEVNIEHTWPQSKFNPRFNKEMQKSDLHHLYPTDSKANNRRGNHHFGNVSEREDELDVDRCEDSNLGRSRGQMIFTPPTEHQGNVARSLFYFAIRYQMTIPAEEEVVLRQWHESDPVDEEERERHEAIASYQKVRNPFVDYPELVEKVLDF